MENKYLIIMFLAGGLLVFVGSFFKIMHWPLSNYMLLTGFILDILAVFILFRKIKNQKKTDSQ